MAETFASRRVRFHGLIAREGWRLKSYSIAQDDLAIDARRWIRWEDAAFALLPAPAVDALRPGLGFIIRHQARLADYLVTCWWDNGNELPIHGLIADPAAPAGWRPAGPRESVCVWDIELLAFERDAFVATMMDGAPAPDAYLDRQAAG